ncbi:hypothetical protein AGLY_004301 [Aphis glycines]|uniref:Uncharacterized protein n=1 Tax=Aphis glycines TaxID=307491 RepID=A0A6G0TXR8_APHGL|nr:hypothetical protein AGLY_004301 [Aphis glycines]
MHAETSFDRQLMTNHFERNDEFIDFTMISNFYEICQNFENLLVKKLNTKFSISFPSNSYTFFVSKELALRFKQNKQYNSVLSEVSLTMGQLTPVPIRLNVTTNSSIEQSKILLLGNVGSEQNSGSNKLIVSEALRILVAILDKYDLRDSDIQYFSSNNCGVWTVRQVIPNQIFGVPTVWRHTDKKKE